MFSEYFEERAILLGHCGRYEVALGLYVVILKDHVNAER